MDSEIAAVAAQFGAAGMMGWMWLSERRAAAVREKQLAEAHERLVSERTAVDVLTRCVEGNTRALTALEVGQRQWVEVVNAVIRRDEEDPPHAPRPPRRRGSPKASAGPRP